MEQRPTVLLNLLVEKFNVPSARFVCTVCVCSGEYIYEMYSKIRELEDFCISPNKVSLFAVCTVSLVMYLEKKSVL